MAVKSREKQKRSTSEKQVEQGKKNIAPYMWKPGQSGNPAGRPPGQTLKDFVREMLMNMSFEEKMAYIQAMPPEIVWRMGEGNPHTTEDRKITVEMPKPILGGEATQLLESQENPPALESSA